MYREWYVDFVHYFWIDTDWGLLWLAIMITIPIMYYSKN